MHSANLNMTLSSDFSELALFAGDGGGVFGLLLARLVRFAPLAFGQRPQADR